MKSKLIATGALAAVAAVASAATASAHIDVAVKSVKAHTDRTDSALDRAVALFERNADRRGSRELARSRRELGRATAEAAKLRRKAKTQKRRASAARATALVADQQDKNVEQLVGVLDEAGGRVENTIAKAALSDAKGRDKALAILTQLLAKGISSKSEKGIARDRRSLARPRRRGRGRGEGARQQRGLAAEQAHRRTCGQGRGRRPAQGGREARGADR